MGLEEWGIISCHWERQKYNEKPRVLSVRVGLLKGTEGREVKELFLSFHLNESKEGSVGVIMEG